MIKRDLVKLFQKYLDEFDWVANPSGKLSAKARRKLFAGFVNTVVKDFEKNHPELVKNTANHCGMAIAIDGSNLEKIKPALFPPDFPETLQPQHPLYSDVKEYVPVVDPQSPARRVLTTDPVFASNTDTTVLGDTGLFDDDSDAEGDQVFLPAEVANLGDEGEEEEGSVDSSEEAVVVVRARSRRRFCLEGCDCERVRGRLCECEKRDDGMCGDECQCDPSKCRTLVQGGEDSSEEDSED